MKDKKALTQRIEIILLLVTAVISILIAILDVTGLIDANSWIANRVPTLTLLCVGFIASYLIIERRNHLEQLQNTLESRSSEILNRFGMEVEVYSTSGERGYAIAASLHRAKQIDSVSWAQHSNAEFRWTHEDRIAFQHFNTVASEKVRNPAVKWREVFIFWPHQSTFDNEKIDLTSPETVGYSAGYFEIPSSQNPRRIGSFIVIDGGDPKSGEVFLSSSDNTVLLRVKHPEMVRYYLNYFEELWHQSIKLKTGNKVHLEIIDKLEAKLRTRKN